MDLKATTLERKGPRWYVVQTRPRREQLALRHLRHQDFATYCPLRRGTKRVGRRHVRSLEPFFPGYVFVCIDTERQRWRSINGTIGVVRMVGSGDQDGSRPTPVPEGLVERFQNLSGADGELRFREVLAPGDRVRVVGGPLDQMCGILESAGDFERVTILLEILSKETRVHLSRGIVIPA